MGTTTPSRSKVAQAAREAGGALKPSATASRGRRSVSENSTDPSTARNYYSLDGLSGGRFIPRRNVSGQRRLEAMSFEGLTRLAVTSPLSLLRDLPDFVPEVGKALWNDLRLSCAPGSFSIKAVKENADGSVDEAPDGTYALNRLWDNQPKEAGKLLDLLEQNIQMLMFSGMCAMECVLATQSNGVAQVWPVDSLSLNFRREPDDNNIPSLVLYQRQYGFDAPANRHPTTGAGSGLGNSFYGYEKMPMERFFWAALDVLPGEPYGRAPYAPVLAEVLANIAFLRDLVVAWHRVGVPRIKVGVDLEKLTRIAREILGLINEEDITAWVSARMSEVLDVYNNLQADDAFITDSGTNVDTIGSGSSWDNVDEVYDIFQWKLVTALKQMPTLMGITKGDKEAWSSVEWQIYTQGLQTIIHKAVEPLLEAANLHLRLMGLPYTAKAEIQPIRAAQQLQEQQAEQLLVLNLTNAVKMGWITNDEASIRYCGHKAVEADPAKLPVIGNPIEQAKAEQEMGLMTQPQDGNQSRRGTDPQTATKDSQRDKGSGDKGDNPGGQTGRPPGN